MLKKFLKRTLTIALGAVMAISLASCSGGDSAKSGNSMVEKIKSSNKIILATNPEFPPFEFMTMKDGKSEVAGADISLAKEIAKDLGVELEIKSINFDGTIEALNSGNVDMVISGMNPTPKRREGVLFSELYYGDSPQTILISKANVDKIKTKEDLKGMKIGAQKGSVQEEVVTNELKDSTMKAVTNIPNLIQEVKNGTLDALVLEKPVAEGWVKSSSNDFVIAPFEIDIDYSGYAVAIKKGNEDLVEEINKTIARLKKDNVMETFIKDAEALNGKK